MLTSYGPAQQKDRLVFRLCTPRVGAWCTVWRKCVCMVQTKAWVAFIFSSDNSFDAQLARGDNDEHFRSLVWILGNRLYPLGRLPWKFYKSPLVFLIVDLLNCCCTLESFITTPDNIVSCHFQPSQRNTVISPTKQLFFHLNRANRKELTCNRPPTHAAAQEHTFHCPLGDPRLFVN